MGMAHATADDQNDEIVEFVTLTASEQQSEKKQDHNDFMCSKKEMVKVYRVSNNSPACLMMSSVDKLVQRDWAKIVVEDFNQCVAANGQILESMPKECEYDGQSFAEDDLDYNRQLDSDDMGGGVTTVKVGLLYPATGDASSYGSQILTSTKKAVDDFNKRQESIELELVPHDTKTSTKGALEAISSLKSEGVRVASGPYSSMELKAIMEYVKENEMVLVSCCSTAPSLAFEDSVFRMMVPDDVSTLLTLNMMKADGVKAAAIVYRDDAWGTDFSKKIREEISGINATYIPYTPDKPVPTEIIKKISDVFSTHSSDGKFGVVMVGFDETADILEEFGKVAWWNSTQWYGTDGNALNEALVEGELARIAAEIKFTAPVAAYKENPIHNAVRDHMEADGDLISYVYTAYDTIHLIGRALEMPGDNLSHNIPQAAEEYDGATGRTSMDKNGDRKDQDFNIYRIIDGAWTQFDRYADGNLGAQMMVADAIVNYSQNNSIEDLDAGKFSGSAPYLFVIKDQLLVFHGANSTMIGENVTAMVDSNGLNIGNAISKAATEEGGWVQYMWVNPETKKDELKSSWVVMHDGHIFGAGAYR